MTAAVRVKPMKEPAAQFMCALYGIHWDDEIAVTLTAETLAACDCRQPAVASLEWSLWVETWAPRAHSRYALENGPDGDGDAEPETTTLCAECLPEMVDRILWTEPRGQGITLAVRHE